MLQGEGLHLEMKKCKDSVPKSVWETYSSFANTRGGIILLGVTEHKEQPLESRFEVTGVEDLVKVETDFWNIMNNRQKISQNILVDSDLREVEVDGKVVLYLQVPEADYHRKPIYINNDLQNGTYKRNHEGDRHVTMEELALLMRDSSDDIDSQIIEHYVMDDIDLDSFHAYRQSFKSANPTHAYNSLDDKEFLRHLGGYANDRHTGLEGLTMAGLLMFGKRLPIMENFPNFRVDYLDLIGVAPGGSLKWNDRLTDDGRWEPNIFNFATLVMQKLLFTLPSEGRLHGTQRKDGGELHEAIREAIINTISYCDYKLNGVLRIDRRTDEIIFRNPGTLRISRERIYDGDFTHARNRTIQRMFRMVGYGDNIGSGFQKILAAWRTLHLPTPDLREQPDVQEVWLTLSLKNSSDSNAKSVDPVNDPVSNPVNDPVNSLVGIERLVYETIKANPGSRKNYIAPLVERSEATVKRALKILLNLGLVEFRGAPKTGGYYISFEK